MRSAAGLIALAATAVLSGSQPAVTPSPVPVVVELFTSEGCSSCPPADQLLSKLLNEQPVAGVQIIPLGMHVTYWDQLGWKDSGSLALATERQQDYSRVFGGDRVYTPQLVVDGADEIVGSDESGARRAIAKAAKQPHARLSMTAAVDGRALTAQVTIADLPAGANEPMALKVALTESGLTSIVKRGENGGRTLHHDAVVRAIFGSDAGVARLVTARAELRPEWRRDQMRAVAILQGKKTQRIWGAASVALK
ncbi:MAG TPA: DUF1223 domain-containing protein [Vicinamibacterales bacterium]